MPIVSGLFDTRREAEMTVERLVQQFGIDRKAIRVGPESSENSAGIEVAGSDAKRADPSPAREDEAALNGRIEVAIDREAADAEAIRAAFSDFGAVKVRVR